VHGDGPLLVLAHASIHSGRSGGGGLGAGTCQTTCKDCSALLSQHKGARRMWPAVTLNQYISHEELAAVFKLVAGNRLERNIGHTGCGTARQENRVV